jgi:hypothetical protein
MRLVRSAALILLVSAAAAKADPPRLVLELNGADPVEGGCRISLLVENATGTDIAALGIEAVLFDRAGKVVRLLTLDLQEAPQGRPRLRQFDLPGQDCAGLGRLLVNAVPTCTAPGLDPDACLRALAPRSRVDGIEVLG